jgi:hypothetical protein
LHQSDGTASCSPSSDTPMTSRVIPHGPKEKSGNVEQNRSGHRPRKKRTFRKGDRQS